ESGEQCDTPNSGDAVASCGQATDFAGNPLPIPAPEQLRGGEITCDNCRLDLTQCSARLSPDIVPGEPLEEAAAKATVWSFTEVFDGVGEVLFPAPRTAGALPLDEMGSGNHGVFLFAQQLYRIRNTPHIAGQAPWTNTGVVSETWRLTFAMDAAEFEGNPGE